MKTSSHSTGGIDNPMQSSLSGFTLGNFRFALVALLALSTALLGGCKWENPNAEEEEKEREEFDDRLQGTWRTLCQLREGTGADEDEVWRRTAYEFSGSQVTLTDYEFPDSACIDADLVVESRGDFDIGPEVTAEDGQTVREVDFDYSEVEVTEGETTDVPPTGRRYDILYLRDDDSGFFLGDKGDEDSDGSEESKRPTLVDFSDEYLKQ